jgi:two-component system response regulator CpxR
VSSVTSVPRRILLADDDEGNREVLAYYLRRQGFAVTTAASGAEALRALDDDRFALLLLDVVMPGIDGLDTLRQVRARFSPTTLPVVLFTGLDAPEALDTARALGANGWLSKPYQLADILGVVRRQIESPTPL